jgi:hypothetical protein
MLRVCRPNFALLLGALLLRGKRKAGTARHWKAETRWLQSSQKQPNAMRSGRKKAGTTSDDSNAILEALAKQYGYTTEEVDKAIRALGKKTTDPFTVGLTAFYGTR